MVKRSNNLFTRFGMKVKNLMAKAFNLFKPKKPTEPQQVNTPTPPAPPVNTPPKAEAPKSDTPTNIPTAEDMVPKAADMAPTAPELPDFMQAVMSDMGLSYDQELADTISQEFKLYWYHTHDYYQDINEMTNIAIANAGGDNLSSFDMKVLRRKTKDAMRDYARSVYEESGSHSIYYKPIDESAKIQLLKDIMDW